MESISKYKDTDREILLAMDDKDLLNTCATNKYFYNKVCDDNFFYQKLLRSYPQTLIYFDKNSKNLNLSISNIKTYKQYYLKVVYYVSKLKEEFDYSFKLGNPMRQYVIFKNINYSEYKNNQKLLYHAAHQGELELVKEAIKRGADIHLKNEIALRGAAGNGHIDIVKYLVNLGANIHIVNEDPVRIASTEGHLEVVKYLVEQGADIHAAHDAALLWAAAYGHLDVVKYLVSLGVDINLGVDRALSMARIKGQTEVINYLTSLV